MFVLRWLRRGLTFVGCALLVLFALAFIFERTGGVERLVRRQLQAAIAHEPGLRANFDRLSIDWFGPGATVEGLTIQGAGGALELTHAELVLDARHPAAPVTAIEVRGGRLVFTEGFIAALGRAAAPPSDEEYDPDYVEEPTAFPLINVLDFDFALGGDAWGGGPLELGRGSALVEGDGQRVLATGTIALLTDAGATAPLFFRADLDRSVGGAVALDAAARGLVLESRGSRLRRFLPPGWQGVDMRATASLDLTGRFPLDAALPPELDVRYQITDGYLRASEDLPAIEALSLDGALMLEPAAPGDDWRDRARGEGRLAAAIAGEALVGHVDLQPGGQLGAHAFGEQLTLSDRRLAELGFAEDHVVRQEWSALALDGRADVRAGVRLGLAAPADTLELALSVVLDGESRAQYNGFIQPGIPREGIPLPVDQIGGAVVAVFDMGLPQPTLVGILDVVGQHGTGPVRANGMIASPRVQPAPGEPVNPDMDLVLEVTDRALDETLRKALAGTQGTRWIWDAFQPAGGVAQGRVALRSRPELGGLTALVNLHVEDSGMRWEEFPLDLAVDALDLDLLWAPVAGMNLGGWPFRALGARFEAVGHSASVEALTLRGMVREASFEGPEEITGLAPLSYVRVEAPGLALRGRDFDELGVILPAVQEIGATLGTKGRVDVVYVDGAPGGTAPRESRLELTPRTAELLPEGFPMVTRDVRGRVTMASETTRAANGERVPTGVWLAHLVGGWAGGMRVGGTYTATMEAGAPGRFQFVAGGLDPANSALLGALASGQGSETNQASTQGVNVDGRFDLTGELVIAEERATPSLDVHLRGNRFSKEALVVDDLQGSLRIADGRIDGERVSGRLAQTELVLNDVRFVFDEAARTGDEYFSTRLSAQDVPLDAEHLAPFLEPEALTTLFEEFAWSGRINFDGVRLGLARAADGRESTYLTGRILARDTRINLGAPVEIATAEIQVQEFVLEGGRARAWGTVADLSASLARRAVDNGSFLFSYVDQRLTVQGLETDFAGGKLRSLGGRSATSIAVDLAPPYHMAVSMELEDVDAGPLLEDAFGATRQSGARNEGKFDASLRFEAVPGDILAANGAGWLRVREGRLWSIPVFRELFTQLGFDTTAVFDSMRTSFTIQDGALQLSEMRAHSPLLVLVGDGQLDMNGEMSFDLEVRYSLVDKLGPLRYIVYWFQNNILRVEIRGDLHRPVVLLRNAFFDIFKSKYKAKPRLPLPYPDPLPARF